MEYKIDLSRKGIKVVIFAEILQLIYNAFDNVTQIYRIPIDDVEIDEESGKYITLKEPLTSYQ